MSIILYYLSQEQVSTFFSWKTGTAVFSHLIQQIKGLFSPNKSCWDPVNSVPYVLFFNKTPPGQAEVFSLMGALNDLDAGQMLVLMQSWEQLTQLPPHRYQRWLNGVGARCIIREGCQMQESHTSRVSELSETLRKTLSHTSEKQIPPRWGTSVHIMALLAKWHNTNGLWMWLLINLTVLHPLQISNTPTHISSCYGMTNKSSHRTLPHPHLPMLLLYGYTFILCILFTVFYPVWCHVIPLSLKEVLFKI